jgi:hypothetical protein
MGKKNGGTGGKLVGTLVTAGAVFVARKVLNVAWTRATGKTPPTDPGDPAVSITEALTWAVVAGVTVEVTKLFAARATTRRALPAADSGAGNAAETVAEAAPAA